MRGSSGSTITRALSALLVAGAASCECERPPETPPAPTAKFGVFFGGQIEERRDLPFELDPAKQTQGFRVEFGSRLGADTPVEWKIDRPAIAKRRTPPRKGAAEEPPRGPITGRELVHGGESRFEYRLDFSPGDPLGLWNVRVVAGDRVVLDRPFEVFDPVARTRATPDAGP